MKRALFIHQFGKVGSQAVEAWMRDHASDIAVYRDHGLTDAFIQRCRDFSKQGRVRGDLISGDAKSLDGQARDAVNARTAYKALAASGDRIDVLVGFRDPLSFAVSTGFQMLKAVHPIYGALGEGAAESVRCVTVEYIQALLRLAVDKGETGSTPLDMTASIVANGWYHWMTDELIGFHGLDLDAFVRDDLPYWRCQIENRYFWIYRHDESARALPAILQNMLGLAKQPQLARANDGTAKDYAALYQAVRRSIDVPQDILAAAANLPYVRQFYGAGEVEALWRSFTIETKL